MSWCRRANTEVNLVLHVNEGGKMAIKTIDFEGNKAFSAKDTPECDGNQGAGLFCSRRLDHRRRQDEPRTSWNGTWRKIAAYYYNHGYIKAKVGEPKIDIKGKWIYITIPVQEGPEYQVGKIDITGDLLEDKDKLVRIAEDPQGEDLQPGSAADGSHHPVRFLCRPRLCQCRHCAPDQGRQ